MSLRPAAWIVVVALVALLVTGCPSGTPPPEGDFLVYNGPTEVQLAPGETLAPTDIVFLGVQDGRGKFIIDDLKATRQIGDSLDWDGEPLPGVRLSLHFRILWFRDGNALLAGTARITVRDVAPAMESPQGEALAVYRVPVSYRVDVGKLIPGTTWGYAGTTDRGAKLSGIEEYPFRKVADSILWEGRLRPDVGLALNLRVVRFDEQSLRVAGIATITLATEKEGNEP